MTGSKGGTVCGRVYRYMTHSHCATVGPQPSLAQYPNRLVLVCGMDYDAEAQDHIDMRLIYVQRMHKTPEYPPCEQVTGKWLG